MSLQPFSSQLIADVGISFGDEGKGRLIPEVIAELAGTPAAVTAVFKVNGGSNSGHTAGGIKLNLLPAGVVEKSVPHLAIGAGVVADPRKILWEARPLEPKGYAIFSRLVIDERTMVTDLSHRLLDLAWEDYRVNVLKEEARGSTGGASHPRTRTRPASGRSPSRISWAARTSLRASSPPAPTARCARSSMCAR